MCYVNITNSIAKTILKTDKYHIYFKSCGHKVHKECFYKFYDSKTETKDFPCFLCKKKTNIIIPQLSKKINLS